MANLVGRAAPDFSVEAAIGKEVKRISLADYRGKSFVALFFYPGDFTPVCHSEMHALQERMPDFKRRETEAMVCSADSVSSHVAWLTTPREKGGIEGSTYPVLSDHTRRMATDYDVAGPDGHFLRGLFIIDKKGIVRHSSYHESTMGRSIEEVLRTIDAIQHTDNHGHFCPANWTFGKPSLTASVTAILNRSAMRK